MDKPRKKYHYIPVSLDPETEKRLRELAAEHRRAVAQEAGQLIELGIKALDRKRA